MSKNCITHGKRDTKLYNIWSGMKQRCIDKNYSKFNYYGGRGISVCNDWITNFNNFYNWSIANGYKPGLSIDRINNDGNYSPLNCRWIERGNQNRNKRNNIFITAFGEEKTASEWVRDKRCLVGLNTILRRFRKNIKPEEAISKSVHALSTRKYGASGIRGVWYESKLGKWRARITKNHTSINLGCFENKEDAKNAYKFA